MAAEERAFEDTNDESDGQRNVEAGQEIRRVETTGSQDDTRSPLPSGDIDAFRVRWEAIQAEFVDEPRRSVKAADKLVTDLMEQLSSSFSEARMDLERQWDRGDDVSTEDLRVTLQRYRSFFERLLAA